MVAMETCVKSVTQIFELPKAMAPLDPKYVASTRSINRRTATKQALRAQPVNPVVQERLAAIKARNRFGAPLVEQLRQTGPAKSRIVVSPWSVLGSILAAASTIALLLAWIQHSLPLGIAGVLGLPVGIVLALYGLRASSDPVQAVTLFDESSLQAFDRMLDQLAPEVPGEVATRLTEIKQQLTRIARLANTSTVDENFTMEDRMYLTESVRRYLPDSLQSYLMVPQNQRSTQILEDGQTAVSMLLSQLNLLHVELAKQEMKLTRSSAEKLVKQQRFLESKAKR
jgi:hypothetical protein